MLNNSASKAMEREQVWLQSYVESPEKQSQLYKQTLLIVVISQIFGGAGLTAGITVGALLAQDMMGSESMTGVPSALFTLGSAGAALIVGRLSQRFGRRSGLASGFATGGIGAIGVVVSALTHNIPFLFISLLIYGAGTATNLQVRYTGTDLAKPTQRATAISIGMVSTTFGAVAAPNLVDIMGHFALAIGVPALAGPFILAAAAYILAGLVLLAFLRPDPFIVANAIVSKDRTEETVLSDERTRKLTNKKPDVVVGATLMVLTQIIMVSIMTMTPVFMRHHGHSLKEIGMVISFHVAAMYLPSPITGILVDKIGRKAMAIASGVTLLAAGVLAAVASSDSLMVLIIALSLLGLGWNFGFICGTTLIVDATHPSNRAKIQGSVDVLIALAGVTGGALSGLVVAHSSYATLSLTGGMLSLILIAIVFINRKKGDQYF